MMIARLILDIYAADLVLWPWLHSALPTLEAFEFNQRHKKRALHMPISALRKQPVQLELDSCRGQLPTSPEELMR